MSREVRRCPNYWCNKPFKNASNFPRHFKTCKIRPIGFMCHICKKTGKRRQNIIRHIKLVHSGEEFAEVVPILPTAPGDAVEEGAVANQSDSSPSAMVKKFDSNFILRL